MHTVSNAIALHEMAALSNSVLRDELTGLLNRRGFLEEAPQLIEKQPANHYVLTLLNFENFKLINDQYGTAMGDKLLKYTAKIIQDSLYESDDDGIAAYLNSDKFIVLSRADSVGMKGRQKYYDAVSNPPFLAQRVRFHLGRCLIDDISRPLSNYIDRAFMAERSIQREYGNYSAFFDEKMMDSVINRQKIAGQMTDALHNHEFVPYFQPQYNHADGKIIGAEALVRWIHDGKIIPPNEFIPLFEQNGFIYEMDKDIWESVCKTIRRWLDEGKNPPPVSVNISRYDLLHDDCQEVIASLLKKYSLPKDLLRLEITESAFSSDSPVFNKIGKLIEAGFTVEIDDFGSGYSSLNALKDVKASILKLDMRFFERCADETRAATIVQFSVRLAKWLGMDVIAEGVETKPEADFLKSTGCFFIQGFLYSKPLPVDEYDKLLSNVKFKKLGKSPSSVNYRAATISDPSSFDTWVYKTKAGPACILELKNDVVEVLRVNDAYVEALSKINVAVENVLRLNWLAYFDDETKKKFPSIQKRILSGEMDVESDLVFIDMPNCPPKVLIKSKQTLLAKGPDSIILYCAVEFFLP